MLNLLVVFVEFRLYHYKVPFLKNGESNWISNIIFTECLYLLSDIRFCISMVFAKKNFAEYFVRKHTSNKIKFQVIQKTMKSWAKQNLLKIHNLVPSFRYKRKTKKHLFLKLLWGRGCKIQIIKIFDTVDHTQFLTSTRERKEEYAEFSLFKLEWPILGPTAPSRMQFRSVKKAKSLSYRGKLQK